MTMVALVAIAMGLASCAKETVLETPAKEIQVRDTLVQKVEESLRYETFLESKLEVKNDTAVSELNFDLTSKIYGKNDEGVIRLNTSFSPTAEADVKLTKKVIEVEEFFVPQAEIGQLNIKEVELNSQKNQKMAGLSSEDKFSDGQSASFSAEWMWQYVEDESSTVDVAHVEFEDIIFKSAELVDTEDGNLKKVVLNYVATYKRTDSGQTEEVEMAPFYFQRMKEVSEPEINVSGEPYFICDTTMTLKNGQLKCKMVISKVTPNTMMPNDTVKIAQRILTVAQMGKPGDETLYVFQKETTENTHDVSETVETEGSNGNFSWIEKKTTHTFRASWNTNGLEGVGHTDKLVVIGVTMKYADPDNNVEFVYDFNSELKVVQNDVVVENSDVEGYLGTRVLTVAGYCNGEQFAEYTGKTTLVQHQ